MSARLDQMSGKRSGSLWNLIDKTGLKVWFPDERPAKGLTSAFVLPQVAFTAHGHKKFRS